MNDMLTFKLDETLERAKSLNKEQLVADIHALIQKLNNNYDFDPALAEEWVYYLLLLLNGYKDNLSNPYGDLENYSVESFSQSTPGLETVESLILLNELPNGSEKSNRAGSQVRSTLFITALGGTDTTFYKGVDEDEAVEFANDFFAPDLVAAFQKYEAVHLIPRGFAAKKSPTGKAVTNVESMILQAYAAGFRNIAVIANAMTCYAIEEYLEKFRRLDDLTIIVTAQPLLPRMHVIDNGKTLHISEQNGGYPGGHGHGFKYCLTDKRVRDCIERHDLRHFLFTNGDNAAVLNWGGDHFDQVLTTLDDLKQHPQHKNLRIGFFLVWEYLRKGGFSFLLTHKKDGATMPQIFEAELAKKSGANIEKLKTARGGYNTNVAVGMLDQAYSHLQHLPMVIKEKSIDGDLYYSFEASLATAMTTQQNKTGRSNFDPHTAVNILGPTEANYQHWNHIALRTRDDLFAFHSSLFKVESFKTPNGSFPLILTRRDATQKHPTLAGNVVDANLLNTKEFFEIFANASINVDDFYGTLYIDLLGDGLDRGTIRFEKNITFIGDENSIIKFTVPAGEKWIVANKVFHSDKKKTITPDDVIVLTSEAAN